MSLHDVVAGAIRSVVVAGGRVPGSSTKTAVVFYNPSCSSHNFTEKGLELIC